MEFAQNLKATMDSKSITMYRLAKELGVHQTTIKNWLAGKGEPRISEVQSIAVALGVDPYSLYSFDQATEVLTECINARDRIDAALDKLNDAGMEKAADVVEIITEVPRYRSKTAPESPQPQSTTPPPDVPTAPPEGG